MALYNKSVYKSVTLTTEHNYCTSQQEIVKKLEPPQLHTVRFFSFNQDWGSILNSPEGRERLGEVGIGTPADVGLWLVDVFKNEFDQEALAHRLECFMQKTDKP